MTDNIYQVVFTSPTGEAWARYFVSADIWSVMQKVPSASLNYSPEPVNIEITFIGPATPTAKELT